MNSSSLIGSSLLVLVLMVGVASGEATPAQSPDASKSSSVVKNGAFEQGISGWTPQAGKKKGKALSKLVEIAWEQNDAATGKGALRVALHGMADASAITNKYGVVCKLTKKVGAGEGDQPGEIVARFDARSVKGASVLKVGRLWGGVVDAKPHDVKLTNKRKSYEVRLTLKYATRDVIFSLADHSSEHAIVPAWDGVLLLDNVRITQAQAKDDASSKSP